MRISDWSSDVCSSDLARFEFSSMPVTGGSIRPHTDAVSKAVTMVIPMLREGEWKAEYGGGTSVVWPKDRSRSFNLVNGYLDFDKVDCLKTYPFEEIGRASCRERVCQYV